jgi:hypothetical protein
MTQRITSSLLIALVVCQIGGAWMVYSTALWLHVQKKEIRLADSSKWTLLELTTSEFSNALVEKGELRIHDSMFDIVSFQIKGDIVCVFAVPDTSENKLRNTLDGLQSEDTGWAHLAKLAQVFSMTPFVEEVLPKLTFTCINEITNHTSLYRDPVSCFCSRGLDRPPSI